MAKQDDPQAGDLATTDSELSPKRRIFEAAVSLFARKGFNGTGVREIAKEAGVNPAMVNYYYGSKIKVLQAIMTTVFDRYAEAVKLSFDASLPLEERVRTFFRRLVQLVRANSELFRIMVTEMHFQVPEMADFKAKQIREKIFPTVVAFVQREQQHINPHRPEVVGPALAGMVIAHFVTAPVFSRVVGAALDDDFYQSYPDQLADLALYGLVGRRPAAAAEEEAEAEAKAEGDDDA